MAAPAQVVTQTSQGFVTLMNIYQPQALNELVLQAPDEFKSISRIMEVLGRSREIPITEPTYFHFELPRQWQTLGVNANVGAPGAGLPITWTLPAADHYGAGVYSWARVGDIVEFNNAGTKVFAQITAVNTTVPNAHTVTATPRLATDAIPALTGGDYVTVLTNAQGEASTGNDPRTPIATQFTFETQTIREAVQVTDFEITNKSYVQVGGQYGWWVTSDNIARKMLTAAIDNAMLTMPGRAASATTAGFNEPLMQGLIPWAESGGNTHNYTPGSFTISDLDAMIDLLDAQKVGSEFMVAGSLNFCGDWDDMGINLLNNGSILYGEFAGKEKIAIALNIQQYNRKNYVFDKMYLPALSDPRLLGNPTLTYQDFGIVVPMGMTVNSLNNTVMPAFETTYKSVAPYNLKYKVWDTGAFAETPTNTTAHKRLDYLCNVGTWPKNAGSFGIFQG